MKENIYTQEITNLQTETVYKQDTRHSSLSSGRHYEWTHNSFAF